MLNRILDFLVVPVSSEEESQLVTHWLRHILLSALRLITGKVTHREQIQNFQVQLLHFLSILGFQKPPPLLTLFFL